MSHSPRSLTRRGGGGRTPALDPQNGFPVWSQDTGGTRLTPCLDAADTNCVVLADAGFDPATALTFPTSFPGEFLYSVVDFARPDTKGCSGTKPGRFSVRMALEGSFVNGTPVPGDQMVFGRLSLTTDSNGALAKNQGDAVNSPAVAVCGSCT